MKEIIDNKASIQMTSPGLTKRVPLNRRMTLNVPTVLVCLHKIKMVPITCKTCQLSLEVEKQHKICNPMNMCGDDSCFQFSIIKCLAISEAKATDLACDLEKDNLKFYHMAYRLKLEMIMVRI